jgi:hypothetical protein
MKRTELEHVIRAAAANANVREIVVIGSQAILGTYPDAPAELLQSMEADVFAKDDPTRSIVIDGAMGELSLFHETFGYYAHGIDETTAYLPDGWRDRLVKIANENTGGAIGWCLEIHDLAVSKLAAAREKDLRFVERMVRGKLASAQTIRERLQQTPRITSGMTQLALVRLEQWKI